MSELWNELFKENEIKYRHANPKRGRFIYQFFLREKKINKLDNISFLEFGAFSAKDTVYLMRKFDTSSFFVSDLSPVILRQLDGLNTFSCDVFNMPLKKDAVDVSFHSGLIILFDDKQVVEMIRNQVFSTRCFSFVFGLNKFNIVDHFMAAFNLYVRRNRMFSYRRFSVGDMKRFSREIGHENFNVGYHDNMVVNFASRRGGSFLRWLSTLSVFKMPFFYNEVFLVIEKNDFSNFGRQR